MSASLKGMFWNCRGDKEKKGMSPFIKDLIKMQNFDFLCFQETMVQDFVDNCLRKIDPNRCYLWDWVPSKEKLGGILSGLKLDRLTLEVGLKESIFYNMLYGTKR
jgi:hypothetical protein